MHAADCWSTHLAEDDVEGQQGRDPQSDEGAKDEIVPAAQERCSKPWPAQVTHTDRVVLAPVSWGLVQPVGLLGAHAGSIWSPLRGCDPTIARLGSKPISEIWCSEVGHRCSPLLYGQHHYGCRRDKRKVSGSSCSACCVVESSVAAARACRGTGVCARCLVIGGSGELRSTRSLTFRSHRTAMGWRARQTSSSTAQGTPAFIEEEQQYWLEPTSAGMKKSACISAAPVPSICPVPWAGSCLELVARRLQPSGLAAKSCRGLLHSTTAQAAPVHTLGPTVW